MVGTMAMIRASVSMHFSLIAAETVVLAGPSRWAKGAALPMTCRGREAKAWFGPSPVRTTRLAFFSPAIPVAHNPSILS